jgi:hypothetical protein
VAEDNKKLENMIDKLAISVANGFLSMDKRFNNAEADLKSFKTETRESFSELNEKMDNLTEVVMENHDKRIEALEEKAL